MKLTDLLLLLAAQLVPLVADTLEQIIPNTIEAQIVSIET
jgi:hypothetical protein